ncbi:F-box protein-like protein [Drosera capensis]
MVALRCRNLLRLKLRGCRQVTDDGMAAFSRNCKGLRKLSCGSCDFGTKGLNSVIENCEKLEELSIKRLRGLNDQGMMGVIEPISGGIGAKSLRSVCLKELYNGQVFGPLIIGARNLKSLKLIKCMGDWDRVLGLMSESNDGLVEVHLERLQVSNVGLSAIANCPKLEILHVVKAPDCSNAGVVAVAEKCRLLRKVHIDGWRTNRIGDEGLAALGKYCGNLQELVLIGLNPTVASLEVTDDGMAAFSRNCKGLRKLSCGSCDFGTKGLNSVIENFEKLEGLSIKRLRGLNDQGMIRVMEPISGGIGAKSLRSVCLKELYNGQVFGSLIIGARNLKSLKLIKCMGDWDRVLGLMSESNDGLVEVHLEMSQASNVGLSAIANCPKLEILHVVKAPDCSNAGFVAVAEKCRLLRKELVLIGSNPTVASLEVIASGCKNLERLTLCSSETIRDAEISCIASKCVALKNFYIKSCPISDNGLEALAVGCPNLVKIKVKKCKEVTNDILEWLKERRESLMSVPEGGGALEDGGCEPPGADNRDAIDVHPRAMNGARSSLFRAKFGSLMGRGIAVRALRRWSSRNGISSSNQ